jgi:N-acetyl-alpha-D-glucosaminyl L-malate synthase BshA
MRIAILCYASIGGSGVIATDLAYALALRGHDVHVLSREQPFRWRSGVPGLSFVRVEMPSHPLFREPQYLLGLTNALVQLGERNPLDVVHAHYAVPHATAAYLARQMLANDSSPRPPRTITTLHGTDITLIGAEPSYECVVRFSIDQSDGVTAVSEALKLETSRTLRTERPIHVIPNFLDCDEWRRRDEPELRARLRRSSDTWVVVHVSNFRPVKRVDVVLEVFRLMLERVKAVLLMIGDGPDRSALEKRVADLGLGEVVQFVGEQRDLVSWLSASDLFLLPSSQESFGLAALEAMACQVPVIASRVGGLPEVIEDGVTGVLCPPDAIAQMAERGVELLTDPARRAWMGQAAAAHVRARYCVDAVVPQYEAFYEEICQTT